ncbi:MAG: BREX-1 system adenine-specific DNA-methyltransferase PglX [Bacteroidetes bacterium]|jgi:hypothetical protein|nr:BREX-1 system adenine-specific DNA-methyltransferase PglX [Bacteroidota bacterium]
MNTNNLKRFAQQARRKLLEQIAAKLEQVLLTDSAELREKAGALRKLQEEINHTSKEQVIDKVAYTWFNRLMALRFMDANDYQPLGVRIITPKDGYTLPEILDEAKQGQIPDELPVKPQHIYNLLDGKIPSTNAQNEAYKELLIGACNHLNKVFPFLFERLNDYAELLLPDDLTSEFSIVQDMREGMTQEDCLQVEIIGWLYQFYISEKKDEVFASNSKVKKEDIPAATQLFTPRWIVEYMVQNTLGKLWLQNRPNSRLRESMPYFIETPSVTSADYLKVNSVEEITVLDQACGSGHILVYAFDLFAKIYEEEGFNATEIPQLIIEKNLYGFEIDERAAQLAGMALMMKARSYQRRLFRKDIVPHILCFQDLLLSEEEIKDTFQQMDIKPTDDLLDDLTTLEQASNLGSLICPNTTKSKLESMLTNVKAKANTSDAFLRYTIEQLIQGIKQLVLLAEKYHCVVDNPPYMSGGNMNTELANFVKKSYPDSKADLMACFMEAGLKSLYPKGYLGMINQHSWMFLSSYEKLREKLINNAFLNSLLHLGPRTFPEIGGEVVQNASFIFWNTIAEGKGSYIRLVDHKSSNTKQTKTIEAIQNPNCGWFFTTFQKEFEKIPGSPFGYWASNRVLEVFKEKKLFNSKIESAGRTKTHHDLKYLRMIWEVSPTEEKWKLCHKGGEARKWIGNQSYYIDWSNSAKSFYKSNGGLRNEKFNNRIGITWGMISSGKITYRIKQKNSEYLSMSPTITLSENHINYFLGFLNSNVSDFLYSILDITLGNSVGNILKIPFIHCSTEEILIDRKVSECLHITKEEWDSRETSEEFKNSELLINNLDLVEEAYSSFCQNWANQFIQLHKNEVELNRLFIEIYGLQEELISDVHPVEITLLKEEAKIENGKFTFQADKVFAQFISYAVGCMFGRYSLHKEGLILANQGETLEDYLNAVTLSEAEVSFLPDYDNIIPVLDDEWFEDDITGRFYEFLKVSFGKENFEKNLAFVEDALGKDIRKYFVKDFYPDHIRRYKKRPIYWMFSSPRGSFNVLIYLHRYTPDTLNQILNGYLKEYREKLNTHMEQLDHLVETGSSSEQTKAAKEKDKLRLVLLELQEYERDTLYPLASERISIDLDDGVLVNYNKFGKAIKPVAGLNDAKTKEKVKGFDWIDTSTII